MVHLEEKFIDYQFKTAAERHKNLLQYHPELFKRIKLQHLASYLRMSQVSLSRIRAGIQQHFQVVIDFLMHNLG